MPDRPEVTVTNPRAPYGEPAPEVTRVAVPKVVLVVGGTVLVALLVAVLGAMLLAKRNDDRASAEGRLLKIGVVSAAPSLLEDQPALDRRFAAVDLTVANEGPLPVRVVSQQLDGGPPADPGPAVTVAAMHRLLLHVRWRIRCSQVGTVLGPGFLSLTVRAPHGDHVLRVALESSTARAFHLAAVGACAP
jgi:hypothetical protein